MPDNPIPNPDCISIRTIGRIVWAKVLKRLGLLRPVGAGLGAEVAERACSPDSFPCARFGGAAPEQTGLPEIPQDVCGSVPRASRLGVDELADMVRSGRGPVVLDIREPSEVAAAGQLPGCVRIPMSELSLPSQVPVAPGAGAVAVFSGGDDRAAGVAAWLCASGRQAHDLRSDAAAVRARLGPDQV